MALKDFLDDELSVSIAPMPTEPVLSTWICHLCGTWYPMGGPEARGGCEKVPGGVHAYRLWRNDTIAVPLLVGRPVDLQALAAAAAFDQHSPPAVTWQAGRVIAEHPDGTVSVRVGPAESRPADLSPELQQKVADLHLSVAKCRIAELEALLDANKEIRDRALSRANMLSDKCGELDTRNAELTRENRTLLDENRRLRREAERRGGRR